MLPRLRLPAAGKDGELTGAAEYAVLLECLSNLVSNELFGTGEDDCPDSISAEYGSAAADSVVDGILSLSRKVSDLVIVISAGDYRKQPVCIKWDENGENPDTGDLCGWDESTALYLKVLGEINCRLGMLADRVIEVSAGIPVVIK